jgi:hypothetical protein
MSLVRLVTGTGKVLQPGIFNIVNILDESLISAFNLAPETIVHITSAPIPVTSAAIPAPAQETARSPSSSSMDSPMMKQLLSNPELLNSIMESSPALKNLIKENPEAAHMLRDPEFLRYLAKY